MPINKAAWLVSKGERPLVVKEAPYTSPGPNQVTIKNGAVAINPADPLLQETGMYIQQYPYLLGFDVAGTIEEVGENVHHLKKGDRVCGSATGMMTPAMAAFQLYSVVQADVVTHIPEWMPFEQACVLPLATSTASACLYLPEQLALAYPSLHYSDRGKYVFIWGGSSSVGSCGIQLAVNSGYHVITTCSSNNIEYCKSLGAEQAFDYKNPEVVDEITSFLSDKTLAGIMDSISKADTLKSCIEIARRMNGSKKISIVKPGAEKGQPDDVQMGSVVARISGKEVARAIYGEFLPKALEAGKMKAGKMKPKPDPVVIGKGLEHVQEGMDKVRAGVSATKIVVSL